MDRNSFARALEYRAKLDREPDDDVVVRRAIRVAVPRLHAERAPRGIRERRLDMLEIFEDDLTESLFDYEMLRADGRDTQDMADYIVYLADVVAALASARVPTRRRARRKFTGAVDEIVRLAARRKPAGS